MGCTCKLGGVLIMGYYAKRFWKHESGVTPPAILNDGNTACWFTPCDATNVIKDGSNFVSQVNDISGNSRHLLQSTTGKKPLWSVNGILFDGIDDSMRTNTFTLIQPSHVFIVFRNISLISNGRFFDGSAYNSAIAYQEGLQSNKIAMYAGLFIRSGQIPSSLFNIYRFLFNQTNSKIKIMDSFQMSGSVGIGNLNGFTIGSAANDILFSNIEVKEVIIRKIVDTAQNETDIYNYLKSKYGL